MENPCAHCIGGWRGPRAAHDIMTLNIQLSMCLIKHVKKMCGEVEVQLHHSSPRHQMEVSRQLHASATLLPGKESPVPTGQEVVWSPEPVWTLWRREQISSPCRESNPGRSASSQLLSRHIIGILNSVHYLMMISQISLYSVE
jgi:hypothetical protein